MADHTNTIVAEADCDTCNSARGRPCHNVLGFPVLYVHLPRRTKWYRERAERSRRLRENLEGIGDG